MGRSHGWSHGHSLKVDAGVASGINIKVCACRSCSIDREHSAVCFCSWHLIRVLTLILIPVLILIVAPILILVLVLLSQEGSTARIPASLVPLRGRQRLTEHLPIERPR